MNRRVAIGLCIAFVSGCNGCGRKAEPPSQLAIQVMADPYDTVGARGQSSDDSRAIAVIDSVAKSLHYGSVPGDVLRAHDKEPWRRLLVLMLADGDRPQVKAAWISLAEQIVGAHELPTEARLRARHAQASMWDMEHAKLDDEILKKGYLAQIAWCLEGIGSIHETAAGKN